MKICAKYFHHESGDDRLLLLEELRDVRRFKLARTGRREIRTDRFDSAVEGIRAYRMEVGKLREAGYVETWQTDPGLDWLAGDCAPKPDWQSRIDDALLASFETSSLDEFRAYAALLEGTPAAREPVGRWMAAHQLRWSSNVDLVGRMRQACWSLDLTERSRRETYLWSMSFAELRGFMSVELAEACLLRGADFAQLALDAITTSCESNATLYRLNMKAWILLNRFPERELEAFAAIYPHREEPEFQAYQFGERWARYVHRRALKWQRQKGSSKWQPGRGPLTPVQTEEFERALGVTFPAAYRHFLTTIGAARLALNIPATQKVIEFAGPVSIRSSLAWLKRWTNGDSSSIESRKGADHLGFPADQPGVSLRDFIPIACFEHWACFILLNAQPGPHYGKCYLLKADNHLRLFGEQPGFDEMLAYLRQGIRTLDEGLLSFLELTRSEM